MTDACDIQNVRTSRTHACHCPGAAAAAAAAAAASFAAKSHVNTASGATAQLDRTEMQL